MKILAKRPIEGKEITLLDHTQSLLAVIDNLYGFPGKPEPFAERWLEFFGLPPGEFERFLTDLRLEAVFHDPGKANDGFQRAVRNEGGQAIRHEHLSALLLWREPLRDWLRLFTGQDYEFILSAVLTHHLKANDRDHFINRQGESDTFRVFASSDDFKGIIDLAVKYTGGKAPILNAYEGTWHFDRLNKDKESLRLHFYREKKRLQDEKNQRILVALRSSLIVVDAAASGILREEINLKKWIGDIFRENRLFGEDVRRKVIQPRITEIEGRTGKAFRWHSFQEETGQLGARALLLAGCGAGKTLAAWRWAERQAAGRPLSRIIFLYPTRATATEGFRDYVSWAGGDDAALLHGTSEYDLEGMFTSPSDSRTEEDFSVRQRLFALGYWPKRLFSATVDSFLGFMKHGYGSICLMPLLADSAVVIDEVHSFDRSMFTALERFLRFFKGPVLCMTASLTQDRLRTLKYECGLEVFPQNPSEFADLEAQSKAARYRVWHEDHQLVEDRVKGALADGQKVLWVVNTVDRCQQVYASLEAFCREKGIAAVCYHSRFRLQDRKEQHETLIDLFRSQQGGILAVTTQVCEMSLDLDAEGLVSEVAPVTSLIQRMGRCCRIPFPGNRRGEVLFYHPPNELPYSKEEIAQGTDFTKFLSAKNEVSQYDLTEFLDKMAVADPHIEGGYTGFLDSKWYAMSAEERFREGIDFTVDSILDSDLTNFLEYKKNRKPVNGLVVPVPQKFTTIDSRLGKYFRLARSALIPPLRVFT